MDFIEGVCVICGKSQGIRDQGVGSDVPPGKMHPPDPKACDEMPLKFVRYLKTGKVSPTKWSRRVWPLQSTTTKRLCKIAVG